MSTWVDGLTLALAAAGVLFSVLSAVGLVRFPDVYSRLQAASKGSTLGAIALLAAAAVHFGDVWTAVRCLVVIVFLSLTAPLAAHLLARGAYHAGVPLDEDAVLDELAEASPRRPGGEGDGPERRPGGRRHSASSQMRTSGGSPGRQTPRNIPPVE
jgi:multicomponent Na+:H+ antiporter subunit G